MCQGSDLRLDEAPLLRGSRNLSSTFLLCCAQRSSALMGVMKYTVLVAWYQEISIAARDNIAWEPKMMWLCTTRSNDLIGTVA
jgi:hypothetical protein